MKMNVTIVPISEQSRSILASAPGWQETEVPLGKRVASHYHSFRAYYFTFGISKLRTGGHEHDLPQAAMIVVPEGVAHSWISSEALDAVVGHFHRDHGYHFIEDHDGGLAVQN
jgi:mannose-6-phosphate isomerase-like protein (cupin superfamily)